MRESVGLVKGELNVCMVNLCLRNWQGFPADVQIKRFSCQGFRALALLLPYSFPGLSQQELELKEARHKHSSGLTVG